MMPHTPILALLFALLLVLATIVFLTLWGVPPQAMAALGLGAAVGVIVGALAGIAQPGKGGAND